VVKQITGMFFEIDQVFTISGIGKGIQHNNAIIRIFVNHITHKIRADESGAAGDKNGLL